LDQPLQRDGTNPANGQPALGLDPRAQGTLTRFLKDWIFPRWKDVLLALAFTSGLAASTGAYPLIIKSSFDSLMAAKPGVLPLVLMAIVAVTALRGTFLYFHNVTSTRLVAGLIKDMQKATFAHLMEADYARLSRDSTGNLVSRLTNDLGFIQTAVQTSIIASIKDTLSVVALFISMLYIDWMLTLVAFLIFPFAAFPVSSIGRRLKAVAKRTQIELGGMTSTLTETFAGTRLIKAFRLEPYVIDRLNRHFDLVFELRMKAIRARSRMGPALELLAGLAIAGVVAFAFWRISSGISTTGDFMGFITALLLAAQPIRSIGNLTTSTQEGLAAAERIYELLDEDPAVVSKPDAAPLRATAGAIAFDHVSFAYAASSGVPAVRDFTLNIPGGKTAALVGRSGAGKSTIINLVPRLYDVTGGRILIDGQDVRDVTVESLRGSIAIVSQDVTLFDDTIRNNIALGRLGASDEEIFAAAKAAAAHDFILAQPKGYDTVIGESGQRLSGGQKQRLAIARAILKDAPILLLDEATSALDTESERLVQQALARFTRNRTTIVIAHRLSTVQRADVICVMDDGRLVEQGTHAELIARDGAYARLCRSQVLVDIEVDTDRPVASAAS
jgi:subfamily B ATP-binding cassette protein MsbA